MSNETIDETIYNTPMMKQYKEIKEKHSDAFLFFRCGDFYEIFGQDALAASRILDITLTKRQTIPMCGVPYHSVDAYIAKMIKAGKKIAICEQMEDPRTVKGVVKREVTEIITPGTLIEEKLLNNKSNNFLLSLNVKGLFIEIAYLDLSTGDFEVNEIEWSHDLSLLKGELFRIMPREVILPENIWADHDPIRQIFQEKDHLLINRYPAWYFEEELNHDVLCSHFQVSHWSELNFNEIKTSLTTPGVILQYVRENARSLVNHIRFLNYNNKNNTMFLDESTIKNLELISNQQDGSSRNTLLEILDQTSTAMGGRLLKKWLVDPLVNAVMINKRLEIVDFFYKNQIVLEQIEPSMKEVMDLERLAGRIVMDKATPKDLVSIKNSLIECGKIMHILEEFPVMNAYGQHFNPFTELIRQIDEAIKDEPATASQEGNIVRSNYHPELDELKKIAFQSKEYILTIETGIKENYKTPSLKIKYNKILGYFFEVSKLQAKNLPEKDFILRQSLVNTVRYTNRELSEYESKILTAREKINKIEEEIFLKIKNITLGFIPQIQDNAKIISEIDVLLSFARVALKNHYIKPLLNHDYEIIIREGRHPVIEKKMEFEDFIPNDTQLSSDFLQIITGPNMSGKSTYLRQNALIVLMAQIGCFVPASYVKIGVVDRIFTRIGTADNLARGQSTFLVEMNETANILSNATAKSLIIMDEIGRGTSTYDGLAIAWAILEYIANLKFLGAKTLFATHYHELTELARKEGIKNLSVAVSEEGDHFTFLHKIIEQPAEKSYGIHVARLAHLPEQIIYHAELILKKLEDKKNELTQNEPSTGKSGTDLFQLGEEPYFEPENQLDQQRKELINQLFYIDINKITPLQALNLMADLQKKIKKLNLF